MGTTRLRPNAKMRLYSKWLRRHRGKNVRGKIHGKLRLGVGIETSSSFSCEAAALKARFCWCPRLTLTASNMVDIFEIAPQQHNAGASAGFGYAGQGARVARYQHLVSKLSSEDVDQHAGIKIDWFTEDDAPESHNERPMSLKTLDNDDGALVGTFADAAAAMDQ